MALERDWHELETTISEILEFKNAHLDNMELIENSRERLEFVLTYTTYTTNGSGIYIDNRSAHLIISKQVLRMNALEFKGYLLDLMMSIEKGA